MCLSFFLVYLCPDHLTAEGLYVHLYAASPSSVFFDNWYFVWCNSSRRRLGLFLSHLLYSLWISSCQHELISLQYSRSRHKQYSYPFHTTSITLSLLMSLCTSLRFLVSIYYLRNRMPQCKRNNFCWPHLPSNPNFLRRCTYFSFSGLYINSQHTEYRILDPWDIRVE